MPAAFLEVWCRYWGPWAWLWKVRLPGFFQVLLLPSVFKQMRNLLALPSHNPSKCPSRTRTWRAHLCPFFLFVSSAEEQEALPTASSLESHPTLPGLDSVESSGQRKFVCCFPGAHGGKKTPHPTMVFPMCCHAWLHRAAFKKRFFPNQFSTPSTQLQLSAHLTHRPIRQFLQFMWFFLAGPMHAFSEPSVLFNFYIFSGSVAHALKSHDKIRGSPGSSPGLSHWTGVCCRGLLVLLEELDSAWHLVKLCRSLWWPPKTEPWALGMFQHIGATPPHKTFWHVPPPTPQHASACSAALSSEGIWPCLLFVFAFYMYSHLNFNYSF